MTPVTNEQWRRFVAEARYRTDRSDQSDQPDHPVVNVSWHDAVAYCEWAALRLPSELEREKDARGLDGRVYPWGFDRKGRRPCRHYGNRGDEATCSAWAYREGISPWGLRQMSGKVWEWCSDRYAANAPGLSCSGLRLSGFTACRRAQPGVPLPFQRARSVPEWDAEAVSHDMIALWTERHPEDKHGTLRRLFRRR